MLINKIYYILFGVLLMLLTFLLSALNDLTETTLPITVQSTKDKVVFVKDLGCYYNTDSLFFQNKTLSLYSLYDKSYDDKTREILKSKSHKLQYCSQLILKNNTIFITYNIFTSILFGGLLVLIILIFIDFVCLLIFHSQIFI